VDSNGKAYLRFDGLDDFMQTPSIDFTGTDKLSVFAGVRKLSDAAIAIVIEASTSSFATNGTISLRAPHIDTFRSYQFTSRGTFFTDAPSASEYTAPISNVLSGIGDISGDRATLRINGAQIAQSTNDQGTGNYGNHPIYIGSRAGTSLRFNGNIYSLIVRGALSDATEIANAEKYVAQRTGVTL
jgi:hypothetical protein